MSQVVLAVSLARGTVTLSEPGCMQTKLCMNIRVTCMTFVCPDSRVPRMNIHVLCMNTCVLRMNLIVLCMNIRAAHRWLG